jgi:hypothetical protein
LRQHELQGSTDPLKGLLREVQPSSRLHPQAGRACQWGVLCAHPAAFWQSCRNSFRPLPGSGLTLRTGPSARGHRCNAEPGWPFPSNRFEAPGLCTAVRNLHRLLTLSRLKPGDSTIHRPEPTISNTSGLPRSPGAFSSHTRRGGSGVSHPTENKRAAWLSRHPFTRTEYEKGLEPTGSEEPTGSYPKGATAP